MAQYDVVAVARTPNQLTGPSLVEIGPLFSTFDFTEELIGSGSAKFTSSVESLEADIKTRLRNLRAAPMEVWVYREGTLTFAGPVVGYDIKEGKAILSVPGLPFYLNYMRVETDKTFSGVDQFTIAKTLIDDWQDQDYGNFGVNTVSVGTSGVTRDLFIPGATESPTVAEVIRDLGEADDGFDIEVEPDSREIVFHYPERGSDLSASVFLEVGLAGPPDISVSVGPGVVASELKMTGTASGSDPLTSTATSPTVRSSFGRAGATATMDNVTDQAFLDAAAVKYLAARSEPLFSAGGVKLLPVSGAGYEDFKVGDIVRYAFDAGLGFQEDNYRVVRRKVEVSETGTEALSVEFG